MAAEIDNSHAGPSRTFVDIEGSATSGSAAAQFPVYRSDETPEDLQDSRCPRAFDELDGRTSFTVNQGDKIRATSSDAVELTMMSAFRSTNASRAAGPSLDLEREEEEMEALDTTARKRKLSTRRDDVDALAVTEIPEIKNNMYQTKKTIAQGLLDIALLTANASQLKNLLETENHPHFEVTIAFLIISIVLQILVAILLLVVGRMDFENGDGTPEGNRKPPKAAVILNDIATVGIFLVTAVNVFIASFISHGKAYIPTVNAQAAWNEKVAREHEEMLERVRHLNATTFAP